MDSRSLDLPGLANDGDFGAVFSPCRRYRYRLWRHWRERTNTCVFLMLNPSTADEVTNDPTVARCQKWAYQWGCSGLEVVNIFAFRSTDPEAMKRESDPVGPSNDHHILEACTGAALVICAWGNHGTHNGRAHDVRALLRGAGITPQCFVVTKEGEPGHPLYLPGGSKPVPYIWE